MGIENNNGDIEHPWDIPNSCLRGAECHEEKAAIFPEAAAGVPTIETLPDAKGFRRAEDSRDAGEHLGSNATSCGGRAASAILQARCRPGTCASACHSMGRAKRCTKNDVGFRHCNNLPSSPPNYPFELLA